MPGQAVKDFQGVRWMLADMEIQTEAARGLVYKAAAAVDAGLEGDDLAIQAAIAKCHATDTAMQVATDAVQLFGASGISQRIPNQPIFSRCESAANRRRDQPNSAEYHLSHYVAVSEAALMSSSKAGLIWILAMPTVPPMASSPTDRVFSAMTPSSNCSIWRRSGHRPPMVTCSKGAIAKQTRSSGMVPASI